MTVHFLHSKAAVRQPLHKLSLLSLSPNALVGDVMTANSMIAGWSKASAAARHLSASDQPLECRVVNDFNAYSRPREGDLSLDICDHLDGTAWTAHSDNVIAPRSAALT